MVPSSILTQNYTILLAPFTESEAAEADLELLALLFLSLTLISYGVASAALGGVDNLIGSFEGEQMRTTPGKGMFPKGIKRF